MKHYIVIAFILGLVTLSCSKQNAEDLKKVETENPVTDTTNNQEEDTVVQEDEPVNVSYTNDVKPILERECVSCHSPSGNVSYIPLHTYENVVSFVPNPLLGTIKHEPGFSKMPLGREKLPQEEIDLIEVWINEGALNN